MRTDGGFRKGWPFVVIFSGMVLFAAMSGLSCKGEKKPPAEVVRPVKLLTLTKPGLYMEVSYPATVDAFREVDLSFLVSGRLLKIPVRRGQSVRKGDVLAKLDPVDYENRLRAAQARSNERSVYRKRVKDALDQGGATETEYDEAVRQYEVAKADTAIERKALDDTMLRAPFDGEIGRQMMESYQDVAAKEAVFRLQDVTKLKIVVDVPERLRLLALEAVRKEADRKNDEHPFQVRFEDLPGRLFDVAYFEDEKTADPFTRTYRVSFLMDAPEPGLILPGMSAMFKAHLRLKTSEGEPGFYLPVTAVFSGPDDKRYVWVQDAGTQRASRIQVTVGKMVEDKIEVLGGLSVGDTVCTSGVHHIREGMKVRPLLYEARRAEQ